MSGVFVSPDRNGFRQQKNFRAASSAAMVPRQQETRMKRKALAIKDGHSGDPGTLCEGSFLGYHQDTRPSQPCCGPTVLTPRSFLHGVYLRARGSDGFGKRHPNQIDDDGRCYCHKLCGEENNFWVPPVSRLEGTSYDSDGQGSLPGTRRQVAPSSCQRRSRCSGLISGDEGNGKLAEVVLASAEAKELSSLNLARGAAQL